MKQNIIANAHVLIAILGFIFFHIPQSVSAQNHKTDLIVYSFDRPMQLYALLESIEIHVKGLSDIFVITRCSDSEYENGYTQVQQRFPRVFFLYQSAPYHDLKELTVQCFEKNDSDYILFGVDDIIVKDHIDLAECTQALEKYHAHGFFFRLGKNLNYCFAMQAAQPLPPLVKLPQNMCLWTFSEAVFDWNYPNNLDFTLYRKTDIEVPLKKNNYKTPNSLEIELMRYGTKTNKHGICYESSRIINIPLNIVQSEFENPCLNSHSTADLLNLFNNNLKIDLTLFSQIINTSAHAPLDTLLNFIVREQPLPEKLMVIVTPSYNNKDWWQWNLESLLAQRYQNYYILITDDCSPDGTGNLIEEYIEKHKLHDKVKLIKNKERRGALHNLYTMIHSCPNEAIMVTVDGDDALSDPLVLSRLNEVYSKQEVWLTYGQFIEHPGGAKGWCTPMPEYIVQNNAFREYPHLPSHLRTFYAWLFKRVKLQDMLDQKGDFYAMTWDYVMMLPMIEMAGERHLCFQDQVMYIYNNANTISDHRISRQLQQHCAQVVRAKQRYTRLQEPSVDFAQQTNFEKADFIIFAEETHPSILEQFLGSLNQSVVGLGDIHILYLPNAQTTHHYKRLKDHYPLITFHEIDSNQGNFRNVLADIYLHRLKNNYIVFACATNIIEEPIDLSYCIKALQETNAYAFSLQLSKENPCKTIPSRLVVHDIMPDVCAWNYALANDIWASANTIDMALYQRATIPMIAEILKDDTRWLWSRLDLLGWWSNEGNLDKIGLCYKHPKVCRAYE